MIWTCIRTANHRANQICSKSVLLIEMFGERGGAMDYVDLIEIHAMLQIRSYIFHPKLMECPFLPLHLTECPKCGEGLTPSSKNPLLEALAFPLGSCKMPALQGKWHVRTPPSHLDLAASKARSHSGTAALRYPPTPTLTKVC